MYPKYIYSGLLSSNNPQKEATMNAEDVRIVQEEEKRAK
jgi:hypothetical protein